MSASKIIQAYARKSLTKNQGSGIINLAGSMQSEAKAGEIVALLQRAGIPMNQLDDYIRSEKDLLKFLNIIEAASKPRVISATSPEGKAITEKLFGKKDGDVNIYSKQYIDNLDKEIIDSGLYTKKEWTNLSDELKEARRRKFDPNYDDAMEGMVESNVVDMTGKNIDTSQGIIGGKSVKELMESGQVQKGTDNIKISEKITDRELFRDSTLNKEPVNEKFIKYTIQDINKKDPIEGMKIANKIIKREGEFKDLTEEQSKRILKETDDHLTGKDMDYDPEDFYAKGGRAGFYTGGITDVEPSLDDIGHGSDSLMSRTRLMSPGSQATTSTGLNYLLAEDNDNLRVPFAGGGDPKRRAFLKLLATLTGGAAAFKSGLLSLGEGGAKKAVSETVKQAAGSGGKVPPYFLKLVDKIKTMGDDVTAVLAYKDKQKVTKYKDYELTEDLTTGEQTIQKMKVLDEGEADYYGTPLVEETYMSYKPGKGQMDETTKGKTPPDDYEEGTAYLRTDKEFSGDVVDEMSGISDDIFKEVGEEVPEAIRKTKADGGRIGFSSGKLATLLAGKKITSSSGRFLEKIFGRGSLNEISKRDPEMHRGLLEVVEMFRNRDNAGLIEYMQNFLPHMSKKEIQAFIKGDAVDAAGQGKYGLGDMQGQLIRLGSGRDYKGKLEAMKKLDNAQKLDTLDVTEEMIRKPNASGGIQTMLGE